MVILYWLIIGAFMAILFTIRKYKFSFSKMDSTDYYVFGIMTFFGVFSIIIFLTTGFISDFVRGDEYYED